MEDRHIPLLHEENVDVFEEQKFYTRRGLCCSFISGIFFMILLEVTFFWTGAVTVPGSDSPSIQFPTCGECEGMTSLCGAYTTVTDEVELGVEFEATTTVRYSPDDQGNTLTTTTVTVQKDPWGILASCDCPNVPVTLGTDCSMNWSLDECTSQCYADNNVDPTSIVCFYDPKKDQVVTQAKLKLFGVKVTSVFDRDPQADPAACGT